MLNLAWNVLTLLAERKLKIRVKMGVKMTSFSCLPRNRHEKFCRISS
nr:MAG TPA: hypothetical protein [Siphoviridae sp. ct7JV2]